MKIVETWQDARCSDKVVGITAKSRRRVGKTDECTNFASYLVDGNLKCTLHAKNSALTFLVALSSDKGDT